MKTLMYMQCKRICRSAPAVSTAGLVICENEYRFLLFKQGFQAVKRAHHRHVQLRAKLCHVQER